MTLILLVLLTFDPINKIGIMGAMDMELAFIKKDMQIEVTEAIAQRIFDIGTISGMECICVKAGIGKVNAALTAEILIANYNVDAIIFTGVAGGINPLLGIGDIVVSEKVVHHDFGQVTPDEFIPWDTLGYRANEFLISISVDAINNIKFDMVSKEIDKDGPRVLRARLGIIATGDQFIASEEKRQWLEKIIHADCVEMEGAAVAQVCEINRVPFVIIRSMSDLANEDADVDFKAFAPYAAKNSSLIVKKIIEFIKGLELQK